MAYTATDLIREFTGSALTLSDVERWLWTDFSTLDPMPKTVRYCHHPRVGQSNPQQPRLKSYRYFRGHQFRVGESKK